MLRPDLVTVGGGSSQWITGGETEAGMGEASALTDGKSDWIISGVVLSGLRNLRFLLYVPDCVFTR